MSDKYEILTRRYTMTVQHRDGTEHTVHRIRALRGLPGVSTGNLGGWIESDKNLSQSGDCWIDLEATVFGNAKVVGDSWVGDQAYVFGDAVLRDKAAVGNHAYVYDRAIICDRAWVSDDAEVYGDAKVSEDGQVFGEAKVFGHAEVRGTAEVYGSAKIYESGIVEGTAIVCCDAIVDGVARVSVGKTTGHVSSSVSQPVIGEVFKKPKEIPGIVISPGAPPTKLEQIRIAAEEQLGPEEFEEFEDLLSQLYAYGMTPYINSQLGKIISKLKWELEVEESGPWPEALQACDRAFSGKTLRQMCRDCGRSPAGHKKELCRRLYNAKYPKVVAIMQPYLEGE